MIQRRETVVLDHIFRRELRSLLQYVGEAFPWIRSGEQKALAQLTQIIQEERESTAELGRFIIRRTLTPPYAGSYPSAFTSLGFVSLDHLLPMLVDQQRQGIQEMERDLEELTDAGARAQVEKILTAKRQHLDVLQTLTQAHPEPLVR